MTPSGLILALDPSSTCTGYALLRREDTHLVEAGRFMPKRTRDEPLARIAAMCEDVAEYIDVIWPEEAIIEVTSGKVAKRHQGGGAGLATYGMACGAIWYCLVRELGHVAVHPVPENTWTRGLGKKERQTYVSLHHPEHYNKDQDPGGDVADAIGLGMWFLREKDE